MGQATDAILAYGYGLGGDGWKLEGPGEYGELQPLDCWDDEDDVTETVRALSRLPASDHWNQDQLPLFQDPFRHFRVILGNI
jgi:hypothetical protein